MCNKFDTLLDLEGCSGDCIGEGSRSSKYIYEGQNQAQVVQQNGVVQRGWWWSKGARKRRVQWGYPKAKRRLENRWTQRSSTVPQRRIYRSQRKGCICKVMDSRAMSLTTPWYRRGGTSVESSIACSHGGRALVIKGAKEMENAKANSKYQDRAEGQRPRNFIRPVSMGF
ncbi:hypothetical protein B296_00050426, partial [Ensete ventricosum]